MIQNTYRRLYNLAGECMQRCCALHDSHPLCMSYLHRMPACCPRQRNPLLFICIPGALSSRTLSQTHTSLLFNPEDTTMRRPGLCSLNICSGICHSHILCDFVAADLQRKWDGR